MIIEKDYIIDAAADKVWKFVQDKEKFANCIPDLAEIDIKDEKHFIGIVKPKLAFIEGKITLDCTLQSLTNNKGKLHIKGRIIGGTFDANSTLTISEANKKSKLHWSVDVTLEGLLKPVPPSVIKATALFIADKMFDNLNEAVKE